MDRNELKVQALLEKISSLTTGYENQIADLRVEVTMLSEALKNSEGELGNATDRLAALEGQDEVSKEAPADDEG